MRENARSPTRQCLKFMFIESSRQPHKTRHVGLMTLVQGHSIFIVFFLRHFAVIEVIQLSFMTGSF